MNYYQFNRLNWNLTDTIRSAAQSDEIQVIY